MSFNWKIGSTTKIQKNSIYQIYCFLVFSMSKENLYIFDSIITEMTIILNKNAVEKIKNKIRTFEPEIS